MAVKRPFGSLRRLPSGRWQARYTGPDTATHKAPVTFDTKTDADAWLTLERARIIEGNWTPPAARERPAAAPTHHGRGPVLFGGYAETWLGGRDLRPRTRQQYRSILDNALLPAFGDMPVAAITPAEVRRWHATLDKAHPTMSAHTYALLRTILTTAVEDELIHANPCRVRGAGRAARAKEIRPATLAELGVIVDHTPKQYQVMVLLAAWCGLRYGEVTELRRHDIDTQAGTVRVERGVSRVPGGFHVGPPKTAAGVRTVSIPPHLLEAVTAHLGSIPTSPDALVFPARSGGHLAPSACYGWFYPAREAAGRPDLRFHDLRHTGATLAAATGATLAELMARLGHTTPAMAMRYQHAAADRDRAIGEALSAMASTQ